MRDRRQYDLIVVGAGNAGLCAAIAAAQRKNRVLVLEKAIFSGRGGNSSLTMNMRFAHSSISELINLVEPCSDEDVARLTAHYTPYTGDDFYSDVVRLAQDRCEHSLACELAYHGQETIVIPKNNVT